MAMELLGRVEGALTTKVARFLLAVIRSGEQDIVTRLIAYRSLVYLSGAVSKVRIPAVRALSLDDIDWGFVESYKMEIKETENR